MADAEGAEETDAERRQRQQAERIAELRAQHEAEAAAQKAKSAAAAAGAAAAAADEAARGADAFTAAQADLAQGFVDRLVSDLERAERNAAVEKERAFDAEVARVLLEERLAALDEASSLLRCERYIAGRIRMTEDDLRSPCLSRVFHAARRDLANYAQRCPALTAIAAAAAAALDCYRNELLSCSVRRAWLR